MKKRSLTGDEIELARTIFGDTIDYSKVRLFEGKWWPFHPRRAAMAPTGGIWFHPDGGGWSVDFSKESLSRQGFFIHELTHVWQAQKRGRFYLMLMRHPFCRYSYELKAGKPFSAYGIEQQAEMVRHRFLADRGAQNANVAPKLFFTSARKLETLFRSCNNPATAGAGKLSIGRIALPWTR